MAYWCYECKGDGKIYKPFYVARYSPFPSDLSVYVRCETCKGTGIMQDKKEINK